MSLLSGVRLDALAEFLSVQLVQPASAGLTQASAYGAGTLSLYAHNAYAALGNALLGIIAALMFLPLISGWGLYQTMKQPRGKRIAAYAAR